MIQILTYSGSESKLRGENVVVNKLHDARSLDEFEINIIDLQDKSIWYHDNDNVTSINMINDIVSLSVMIKNSIKAKNIILYPQNYKFQYSKKFNGQGYNKEKEIKDILSDIGKYILGKLYPDLSRIGVAYENTTTRISAVDVNAAFYFTGEKSDGIHTKSNKSDKVTTIEHDGIILSTLKLESHEEILSFLNELKLLREKEELPEWIKEVKMFDDNKQLQIIEENSNAIRVANDNISEAMKIINRNNEYKSILYTSGDELVNTVFEILEQMLGCDLSEFQDKKKEDFRFSLNNNIFIGEIKGVTPNVRKTNVSQLDVHVQEYSDDHEGENGNIVALLIINHQRNKPLVERECVHVDPIRLAERNGSLIVETFTLLKLFEKYLSGEKTREECINILKNNVGLLSV